MQQKSTRMKCIDVSHAYTNKNRREKSPRLFCQSPWHGAKQFGLDTSIKVHFSIAVHNTTMAVNAIRAVAKK